MSKWRVSATVAGTKYLGEYEAADGRAAVDAALTEHGSVNLCHQCSRQCEDGEVIEATATNIVTDEEHAWSATPDDWEAKARAAGWSPPKKATKRPPKASRS